jgi:predicted nucleic acid-binding protein
MSLIADSGALYALYDADDAHHRAVKSVVEREDGAIFIPVAILAEVDHLLLEHLGVPAEMDFLDAITRGAYLLESLTPADVTRCRDIVERYRDLKSGLADAAVVATAERLGIHRILTLDERDFRVLRSKRGAPFTLLPADREG